MEQSPKERTASDADAPAASTAENVSLHTRVAEIRQRALATSTAAGPAASPVRPTSASTLTPQSAGSGDYSARVIREANALHQHFAAVAAAAGGPSSPTRTSPRRSVEGPLPISPTHDYRRHSSLVHDLIPQTPPVGRSQSNPMVAHIFADAVASFQSRSPSVAAEIVSGSADAVAPALFTGAMLSRSNSVRSAASGELAGPLSAVAGPPLPPTSPGVAPPQPVGRRSLVRRTSDNAGPYLPSPLRSSIGGAANSGSLSSANALRSGSALGPDSVVGSESSVENGDAARRDRPLEPSGGSRPVSSSTVVVPSLPGSSDPLVGAFGAHQRRSSSRARPASGGLTTAVHHTGNLSGDEGVSVVPSMGPHVVRSSGANAAGPTPSTGTTRNGALPENEQAELLFPAHALANESADSLPSTTSFVGNAALNLSASGNATLVNIARATRARRLADAAPATLQIHGHDDHSHSGTPDAGIGSPQMPMSQYPDGAYASRTASEACFGAAHTRSASESSEPSSAIDVPKVKALLAREASQAYDELRRVVALADDELVAGALQTLFGSVERLGRVFARFPVESEDMYVDLDKMAAVYAYACSSGVLLESDTPGGNEGVLLHAAESLMLQITAGTQALDNLNMSAFVTLLWTVVLYERQHRGSVGLAVEGLSLDEPHTGIESEVAAAVAPPPPQPSTEEPSTTETRDPPLIHKLSIALFAAYAAVPSTPAGTIMRKAFEFVLGNSIVQHSRQRVAAASRIADPDDSQAPEAENESVIRLAPSLAALVAPGGTRRLGELDRKRAAELTVQRTFFRSALALVHRHIDWRVNSLINAAKEAMTPEERAEADAAGDLAAYGANPTGDAEIEHAVRFLESLYEVNQMLQIVPYTEFYNQLVNETLQVREDYPRWKVREGFSFGAHPFVLSTVVKSQILKIESVLEMRNELQDAFFRAMFIGVNCPYIILEVRRSHLIRDAMYQLAGKAPHDMKKQLRVTFVGEDGIDEGGVQKEFFQLVFRDVFEPQYGMFAVNPESHLAWFAPVAGLGDSGTSDAAGLEEYRLIGSLIGLAIYNGVILDLHLPLALYKKLLNVPVGLEDLRQLDPQLAQGLQAMLEYRPASADEDLSDIFGERTFTVDVENVVGVKTQVELEPGGAQRILTWATRDDYVKKYVDYILNVSCEYTFDAFFEGFDTVLGDTAIALFRPEELEELVCGSQQLDFGELERTTRYDGFDASSPTIRFFWDTVHAFTTEQKKRLLFFATGSDRVPIGGLARLDFVVAKNGADSTRLPTAHTCYNVLMLSEYASRAQLEERLLAALNYSDGGFFLS